MFDEIKRRVNIVDAYNKYCEVPLVETSPGNYEPEDKLCPWHDGGGGFHIVVTDDRPGFARCYNPACDGGNHPQDVIDFVRLTLQLDSPGAAAKRINKDFHLGISSEESSAQKVMREAQEYYRNGFKTISVFKSLNDKTPLQYQTEVRGHSPETLDRIQIGWSDGKLNEHLKKLGFTPEEMVLSGLVSRAGQGGLRDRFPAESFIYPAFVNGRPSRFTFKTLRLGNDGKPLAWQMKKENWLNGVLFLGEDTLKTAEDRDNVAIVEGENDYASLLDFGWKGAVLVANGQLSKQQWDMIEGLANSGWNVHTFFDTDEAGEAYRSILWNRVKEGVRQYRVPESYNDIDNFLQKNRGGEQNPLEDIILEGEVHPAPQAENVRQKVQGSGAIIEKDGCYYGIKEQFVGNGDVVRVETKLSNFVMKLHNIYIHRGDRMREVTMIRDDGVIAESAYLSTQARSSLRLFKEFCSRSLDGVWMGTDMDLNNLWLHIQETQRENLVNVPEHCGFVKEENAWFFRNVMISNKMEGGKIVTYEPDENGIFWTKPGRGVMAQPITADILANGLSSNDRYSLPYLDTSMSQEEYLEFQGAVLHHLSNILGRHEACTFMAWAKACAYSEFIFSQENNTPLFLLWGRFGKGKTTLMRWLLSMYDMDVGNKGYMSVANLKSSTVGFLRKAEYYASLPIVLDELRADEDTRKHYNMLRSFYDRSSRPLGTARQGVIRNQPIRATLAMAGQDSLGDAALLQRAVVLSTSSMKGDRESLRSYEWISARLESLSSLGYWWIRESVAADKKELTAAWADLSDLIRSHGEETGRQTNIWKIFGHFANELMMMYYPDDEYIPWMLNQILEDSKEHAEIDIVSEIWEKLAAGQVGVKKVFTQEQIMADNNNVYIWWPGVKEDLMRAMANTGHASGTLRQALKELPYFQRETVKKMGTGTSRRVLEFNHVNGPQVLKEIAETAGKDL